MSGQPEGLLSGDLATRKRYPNYEHSPAAAVREDWIKRRDERDATLPLPERILAALQINLRGGRLPPAEDDGRAYLKLPVNRF